MPAAHKRGRRGVLPGTGCGLPGTGCGLPGTGCPVLRIRQAEFASEPL